MKVTGRNIANIFGRNLKIICRLSGNGVYEFISVMILDWKAY